MSQERNKNNEVVAITLIVGKKLLAFWAFDRAGFYVDHQHMMGKVVVRDRFDFANLLISFNGLHICFSIIYLSKIKFLQQTGTRMWNDSRWLV